MTQDAITVLRLIFSTLLSLFNSWYIPGTHTTPLEFAVFSLALYVLIRLVRQIIRVNGGGSDD